MISELGQSMPEASGIPRHNRFAAELEGKVPNLPKWWLTYGLKAQGRIEQKALEILTIPLPLPLLFLLALLLTLLSHSSDVTYLASNNKRKRFYCEFAIDSPHECRFS
jgi:hypothetical protein